MWFIILAYNKNQMKLEDEIHFLCHCVACENLRSNLIRSVVQNIPQFNNLPDN